MEKIVRFTLILVSIFIILSSCDKVSKTPLQYETQGSVLKLFAYTDNGIINYGGNILIITQIQKEKGLNILYYIADDEFSHLEFKERIQDRTFYYYNNNYFKIEAHDKSKTNYSVQSWKEIDKISNSKDKGIFIKLEEELNRRIQNKELVLFSAKTNYKKIYSNLNTGVINYLSVTNKKTKDFFFFIP